MELTHVYAADIVKAEKDENGDLMVFGKASGPQLDIDRQIADPEWLKSAMPAWMRWGNIREQHSKVAAGIGIELEQDGDDWFLKSAVVDPGTVAKVEKRVLKGYSIGIKGPKIVKDAAAPGGRIVGGEIVEVSLVDRPANPSCLVEIAKAAGEGIGAPLEPVDVDLMDKAADFDRDFDDLEADLAKLVTAAQRREFAKTGVAMPNGDFPIPDEGHLKSAVGHYGNYTGNKAAAKKHIIKRARALGDVKLLPDDWNVSKALEASVALAPLVGDLTKADDENRDIAGAMEAIGIIARLVQSEADGLAMGCLDELSDISLLLDAVRALQWFTEREKREQVGDDMITFGAVADLVKAATADDASEEDKATLDELVKALGVDKISATIPDIVKGAVEEATKDLVTADQVKGLQDELEAIKEMAAPGGPARGRSATQAAKAAESDAHRAKAAHFRQLASDSDDPKLAAGYRTLAKEADAEAAKLATP